MNQLTMSDIQFNFSNVTIALQIGNDGKAQLTFTPTQTTELYANTVQPASEPAVSPAAGSTTGVRGNDGTAVPHTTTVNTVDAPVSPVAATPATAATVVATEPAPQVTLTPPPAAAPAAAPAAKAAGEGTPVAAPLPGVVTKVLVAAGQAVKKGDTVVVLEAMKMENNITAECDGKITGICVAAGDSVLEGTTLVTIG